MSNVDNLLWFDTLMSNQIKLMTLLKIRQNHAQNDPVLVLFTIFSGRHIKNASNSSNLLTGPS